MPDTNRFAGLGSTGDEADSATPSSESDGAETTESSSIASDATETATETEPTRDAPAFDFDETAPKSIYIRPETQQLLEDLEFEVEARLRRQHDIRNLTGREFHDAMVRVLDAHLDDLTEQVVAEREE
ncbi:hypothetical protein ACNS7O_14105 [Haloferacaceae archaeon DSL9]